LREKSNWFRGAYREWEMGVPGENIFEGEKKTPGYFRDRIVFLF